MEANRVITLCYFLVQVVAVQQHYVRPTPNELSETVITEECKLETGLDEEVIKNAQPLDHVIDEVGIDSHSLWYKHW